VTVWCPPGLSIVSLLVRSVETFTGWRSAVFRRPASTDTLPGSAHPPLYAPVTQAGTLDVVADITREYRGLRFTMHSVDQEREQFLVERISDGTVLTSTVCRPDSATAFDVLVDEWIAERLGVPEPPPVYCHGCSTRLVPGLRTDTDYQFDNALWLQFDGGYGMFIDPMTEEPVRAVICHACAHQLCDTVPWLAGLLNPANSHSHRVDQCEDLILEGHRGWDLDPTRLDAGPLLERHLLDTHAQVDLPDDSLGRWALHYRLHRDRDNQHQH
jgi:hypothetical protein